MAVNEGVALIWDLRGEDLGWSDQSPRSGDGSMLDGWVGRWRPVSWWLGSGGSDCVSRGVGVRLGVLVAGCCCLVGRCVVCVVVPGVGVVIDVESGRGRVMVLLPSVGLHEVVVEHVLIVVLVGGDHLDPSAGGGVKLDRPCRGGRGREPLARRFG